MRLVKPRALRPGDCIGIVSTSSPVSAAELDRLTAYLGAPGLRGPGGRRHARPERLPRRAARSAGPPGCWRMFGDPEVSLVMPVSGGTGAGHLVDLLDYGLIRAHPKLFTAFSDPSVLSNSILAAAGLPSVHGVSGFQFFGWADVDEPTETGVLADGFRPDRRAGGARRGLARAPGRWLRRVRPGRGRKPRGDVGPGGHSLDAVHGRAPSCCWRPWKRDVRGGGPHAHAVAAGRGLRGHRRPGDRRASRLGPRGRPGRQHRRTGAALRPRAGSRSSPESSSATSSARSCSRSAAGWSSACAASTRCCGTWKTLSRRPAETGRRRQRPGRR